MGNGITAPHIDFFKVTGVYLLNKGVTGVHVVVFKVDLVYWCLEGENIVKLPLPHLNEVLNSIKIIKLS